MMEADGRRRVRRLIRYARVLRAAVRRGAAEQARWSQFMGITTARMRGAGDHADARDVDMAARYAAFFAALRAQLVALVPPTPCETVHRAALAWVEALDLLSGAVPGAVAMRSLADLEAIALTADEARLRLLAVQRQYAEAVAAVRRDFRARPRAARRLRAVRAA